MSGTFGDEVARLRKARGWTQAQLAAAVGTTEGAVRAWESGRRQPLLSLAKRLAAALGVSLDLLPCPGPALGRRRAPTAGGRPKRPAPPYPEKTPPGM
jgi:transcriptional regulator with XRE-family HTH domain